MHPSINVAMQARGVLNLRLCTLLSASEWVARLCLLLQLVHFKSVVGTRLPQLVLGQPPAITFIALVSSESLLW